MKKAPPYDFPVLMYHGLSEEPLNAEAHRVHVTKQAFKEQIAWLFEQGYKTVPLGSTPQSLALQNISPGKAFSLTFDDGFKSQLTIAAPILRQFNFTATVFITTDWLSNFKALNGLPVNVLVSDTFMDWDDVRSLLNLGWDIASHTATHIDCAKVSLKVLREELRTSKNAIERETGQTPIAFAYPYGSYNKVAIEEVKKYYPIAFSVHTGLCTQDESFKWRQHRIEINRLDTIQSFRNKVLTGYKNPSEKIRANLRDLIYRSVEVKDTLSRIA